MIKVKGQISELALCLEDTEQQISDRAKSFFSEFSRKTNALYNVLPDIISNLIDPDSSNISSDAFRNIMKYLLSFIEKERQTDGLIDKICQRFRVSRTEQQSRDLAFCLSLLNCSERGMKKLLENLPCYQGLLSDDVLYNLFMQILSKAKKNAKVDFKVDLFVVSLCEICNCQIVLEEFEAKLSEIHEKGLEGDEEAMKENLSSSPPQGTCEFNVLLCYIKFGCCTNLR
jgi:condensin complex subunit 1